MHQWKSYEGVGYNGESRIWIQRDKKYNKVTTTYTYCCQNAGCTKKMRKIVSLSGSVVIQYNFEDGHECIFDDSLAAKNQFVEDIKEIYALNITKPILFTLTEKETSVVFQKCCNFILSC